MSFPTSASVWSRQSYDTETMTKRTFAIMLTLWTALGIGLSAGAAAFSHDWQPSWLLMIGTFVCAMLGIFIAAWTEQPVFSLFGYLMIVIPFGLLTGPVIALYTTASAFKVLAVTSGMVVGLGIAGACWPRSLEHWGIWLFGALLVLLLGLLITPIAGAFGVQVQGTMRLWDWLAVMLFSGYVVYDLNRAMRVERTHDNAIDCAVAIYLDFANLFIHLLSIMGTPVKRD